MLRAWLTVLLATGAAAYATIASPMTRLAAPRAGTAIRMMPKSKKDPRVWLPKRSSRFAREVDVALQLVSRGAAAVGHEKTTSPQMATVVAQALVCEGILSEFGS